MGLIGTLLDGALAFYLVLGSTSIGYVFLRLGWPSIRLLDKQYRIGWSIVLGLVFTAIIVVSSLMFSLLPFMVFDFKEFLFLNLIITFFVALTILTVKRKFFASNKVRVTVPGNLLGAKVAASKTIKKMELDKGFITAKPLGEQKLEFLKKSLGKEDAISISKPKKTVSPLAGKIPQKQEAKSLLQKIPSPGAQEKESEIGLSKDKIRKEKVSEIRNLIGKKTSEPKTFRKSVIKTGATFEPVQQKPKPYVSPALKKQPSIPPVTKNQEAKKIIQEALKEKPKVFSPLPEEKETEKKITFEKPFPAIQKAMKKKPAMQKQFQEKPVKPAPMPPKEKIQEKKPVQVEKKEELEKVLQKDEELEEIKKTGEVLEKENEEMERGKDILSSFLKEKEEQLKKLKKRRELEEK